MASNLSAHRLEFEGENRHILGGTGTVFETFDKKYILKWRLALHAWQIKINTLGEPTKYFQFENFIWSLLHY